MTTPPQEWPTRADATLMQPALPPAAPPPYPPEEPDSPIGRGMLLALVALALAVAGALAGWLLTHRGGSTQTTTVVTGAAPAGSGSSGAQPVAVPQVVGLTRQAAVIKIGSAGLRPRIEVRTTGPHDGLVAEQRPPSAQRAAPGSAVTLLLDPPITTTPNQKTAPAKPAPPQQTTTTTAAPVPAPRQPAQATVPDVTGRSEQSGVDALAKAGVLASLVFVPSADDLGTVEAQSKQPGTSIPAQSHVQINLSGGDGKFPPENVPDVIGQTLRDAVSTLNGAQLRLIYEQLPVASRADVGKVVQQTPLAGAKAPQHAQVLVYVGVAAH